MTDHDVSMQLVIMAVIILVIVAGITIVVVVVFYCRINEAKQNREFQLVQLENTQLSGEHKEPNMGTLSAEPSTPWPSAPSHSPLKSPVKNLKYAEEGPQCHVTSASLPPPPQTGNVQSTSLTCNDTVSPASDFKQNVDLSVSLDQILIQLKEVAPKWRELAVAVGAENVNEISDFVSSDSEAMVEVVDGWLAKLYPRTPTWREIADVAEHIGHSSLADSIRQVYVTGVLPIEEINTVSDIQATPLPLPPCITDDGDTHQTPPSDSDSMQQFPPVPVKKAHHIT
jgi:hypothetical protein